MLSNFKTALVGEFVKISATNLQAAIEGARVDRKQLRNPFGCGMLREQRGMQNAPDLLLKVVTIMALEIVDILL